ncbi:MAG TPA: xylulokinase [Ktedonobacterales bacterium]|nr:xylulokinase [Ktedonobacterales bacterium]
MALGTRLVLGLDVSTTAVKATLVTTGGATLATSSSPHSLSSPYPLWSEQEPLDWWGGAQRSIADALAAIGATGDDVIAMGLTGQMHGLTLLDAQGGALRPAILWNDQRTASQCDEIRRRVGRERLLAICGNDALTGFTAPKILWVREHEPEVFARAAHVLLPKDYVRLRLTGEYAMDAADGSGTILFDLRTRTWSAELLAALEIPSAWMPPVFEGPQTTGYVTREAAALTGLLAGTPVVAGGGDQAAGAIGVGAIRPDVVAVTLGTSGVVFAPTARPVIEPQARLHAFCHAVPGMWHLMGVTLSAAGSLQWYRDALAPGVGFDELIEEAGTARAGSDGLVYLPYLSGERTPYPDPLARGAFVGLTLRHGRAELTRAVLEGVAYSLADCFNLFREVTPGAACDVRMTGGGARSALWRSIVASVLGVTVTPVLADEGAALGAGLLAGVGAGVWPTVGEACACAVQLGEPVQPDPDDVDTFARLYEVYRELYPALRRPFHALSALPEN